MMSVVSHLLLDFFTILVSVSTYIFLKPSFDKPHPAMTRCNKYRNTGQAARGGASPVEGTGWREEDGRGYLEADVYGGDPLARGSTVVAAALTVSPRRRWAPSEGAGERAGERANEKEGETTNGRVSRNLQDQGNIENLN